MLCMDNKVEAFTKWSRPSVSVLIVDTVGLIGKPCSGRKVIH